MTTTLGELHCLLHFSQCITDHTVHGQTSSQNIGWAPALCPGLPWVPWTHQHMEQAHDSSLWGLGLSGILLIPYFCLAFDSPQRLFPYLSYLVPWQPNDVVIIILSWQMRKLRSSKIKPLTQGHAAVGALTEIQVRVILGCLNPHYNLPYQSLPLGSAD